MDRRRLGDQDGVSPSALPATLLPPLLLLAVLLTGHAGTGGSPQDEPPQQVTVTSVPDASR